MAWVARTMQEIDDAGRAFIARRSATEEVDAALGIINEWRMSHRFPLNTMQMRLRKKVAEVDRRNPFVSQRIKRLPAVESKLRRLKNVRLSEMQDLGGCRAVVATNDRVFRLARIFQSGRIRHELERENDYISRPTFDGYRSLHLIYQYFSDHNPQYNGQRIEVQLRSRLQHAWATAVETVDSFTNQGLKVNLGHAEYSRFFALMGSWIAYREMTNPVPNTPEDPAILVGELRELATQLNMVDRLKAFRASTTRFQQNPGKYHILDLDLIQRKVRVTSYADWGQASSRYNILEETYISEPQKDVLLASVHGASLRRAYPNYFADTGIFIRELTRALTGHHHFAPHKSGGSTL